MSASAAIADSRLRPACRRAGSPLGRSTSCSRMPPFLTAPRAGHGRLTDLPASTSVALIILRAVDLASRLHHFTTNRHEYCGLGSTPIAEQFHRGARSCGKEFSFGGVSVKKRTYGFMRGRPLVLNRPRLPIKVTGTVVPLPLDSADRREQVLRLHSAVHHGHDDMVFHRVKIHPLDTGDSFQSLIDLDQVEFTVFSAQRDIDALCCGLGLVGTEYYRDGHCKHDVQQGPHTDPPSFMTRPDFIGRGMD